MHRSATPADAPSAESRPVPGVIAAVPTMFDVDAQVDLVSSVAAARHAAGLLDGAFIAGTNGEFTRLRPQERIELTRRALREIDANRVVVHVGDADAASSLALAADAVAAGAVRLATIGPRRADVDGVLAHLSSLRRLNPDAELLLYCYPEVDGLTWDDTAIARVATAVDGFKVSGSAARRVPVFRATGRPVWSGDDVDPWAVVDSGGQGVVSGCASAVPEVFAALRGGGDAERDRVRRCVEVLGRSISHIKLAVSLRGYGRPGLRGGGDDPAATDQAEIRALLAELPELTAGP